jgi:hypothetical protein
VSTATKSQAMMPSAWDGRNSFHDDRPPGRGVDGLRLQDRPHGARRDCDPEMLELALDVSVAPGPVLLGETDDELTNLRPLRRAAGSARVGPAPRHEGSVPAHDRLRTDEQRGAAPCRQNAARGSKQYAVVRLEAWPLYLPAEDVELVAENHDFDLLGIFGAQGKDDDLK